MQTNAISSIPSLFKHDGFVNNELSEASFNILSISSVVTVPFFATHNKIGLYVNVNKAFKYYSIDLFIFISELNYSSISVAAYRRAIVI